MTEYKWLRPDHTGVYGHGDYSGCLPKGKRPGKWLPKVARPVTCEAGYHTVDLEHLPLHWADGAILYEVECRGMADRSIDKSAWEQIRLVRQVGQLTDPLLVTWACDCAERVAQGDKGKAAIAAARAWAACPCEEHQAAAGAASAAAAGAASAAAAGAASAAAGAAGAAAWAASAASAAAECGWQGERLIELLEGKP